MSEKSVHLEKFPSYEQIPFDKSVLGGVKLVRAICNAVLSIRNSIGIKVRMPLKTLYIYGDGDLEIEQYERVLIDELNVKAVKYGNNIDGVAKKNVKIDLRKCGPKLGSKTGKIMKMVNKGEYEVKDSKLLVDGVVIEKEDFFFNIEPIDKADGNIKYTSIIMSDYHKVAQEGVLIGIDTEVTDELILECCAREIVRQIQNYRKEQEYLVSDVIKIKISSSDELVNRVFKDSDMINYISSQTLSDQSFFGITNGEEKGEVKSRKKVELDNSAIIEIMSY
ncbi:DUF5915 domain-containing protein [Rickettsiales bacterium]|nr:DUF5915 domain-containing protein [Rickettsiales bacterium]